MIASTALVPEVLFALPAGQLVRCWDGPIGRVVSSTLSEVDVRIGGSGPWTYERWQVEPVTAAEVQADVMQRASEWRAL